MNWLNRHDYDWKNTESNNNFDIKKYKWPSEEKQNEFKDKLDIKKDIQREKLARANNLKSLLNEKEEKPQNIKKTNRWFFLKKMKNEKLTKAEAYIMYYETIAEIANKLEIYFLSFSEINKNPTEKEVINMFEKSLIKLPNKERTTFVNWIKNCIEKMNLIDKYLSNPIYKNNNKLLVADVCWLNNNLFEWKITVKKKWCILIIETEKKEDMWYITWRIKWLNIRIGASSTNDYKFPINVIGPTTDIITKQHEIRHTINGMLFPEYTSREKIDNKWYTDLIRTKDESIAYYETTWKVESFLAEFLKNWKNLGLYDYAYQKLKEKANTLESMQEYNQKRAENINLVYETVRYLRCFNYMTKMEKSPLSQGKIAMILSITPFEKWWKLLDNYKKILWINHSQEKIELLDIFDTPEEADKFILLKPEIEILWINHKHQAYNMRKIITNLDQETIQKLKIIKPKLDELEIDIMPTTLTYLANFSEIDIEKAFMIKSLGIKGNDIIYNYLGFMDEYEINDEFKKLTKNMIKYALERKIEWKTEINNINDIKKLRSNHLKNNKLNKKSSKQISKIHKWTNLERKTKKSAPRHNGN